MDAFESTITPVLTVSKAAQAVVFYQRAFGAQEIYRNTYPDGRIVAEMAVGAARFRVADEVPESSNLSPLTLKGTTVRINLLVADPDAAAKRAIENGAIEVAPVANQSYGLRQGRLADPFGHHWLIGRPLNDEVGGWARRPAMAADVSHTRHAFLGLLPAIRSVVASEAVAARWDEPSALPAFSVRGLAGHLVRAALTVDTYLDRPEPAGQDPISPAAYFANLDADIASSLNAAIRRRGEELAAGGHDRLIAEFDRQTTRLNDRLAHESDGRVLTVGGNAVMRLDEYLVTRIVELTIHADDLTASVGSDSPTLPPAALNIAIETLVDIARSRHGDLAVLRGLSRRERDISNALRVF
jgi:PhnB protein